MSASNSQGIPVICATAVAVSTKSTKRLKYNEIQVGNQRYKLIPDEDGSLRQEFSNPVELTAACQITLFQSGKSLIPGQKSRSIDTRRLFSNAINDQTQELSVDQDNIQIKFSYQAPRSTLPEPAESRHVGPLHPTTESILEDCPRFRILVIGKMGVGKSSLINMAFGINKAHTSDLQRGEARIEEELTSQVNPRFVLHDSLGFEPGENDKYEIVKNFIKGKQKDSLKDQLHAIWFCIEAPRAGGRLLEAAAEDFFRSKHDTVGTIPIVVVFTKLDGVVNEETMKLMRSNQGRRSQEDITRQARSEAESNMQKFCGEIARLAREDIPCAVVSTKRGYEDTLSNLVHLTYRLVGANDIPDAHVTSVVTMMAQRVNPHLKIQGSIAIGKRKYWKALRASPNFAGHTIQDCLSVIHTDIIEVWNFYDPRRYLLSEKFRELVINEVEGMRLRTAPSPNSMLGLSGGGSLIAAISGSLGAMASPAAPIVIPIVVGLAVAVWVYEVYQNAKAVQQRFIAFIVDLTHIMETLFILTRGEHKRLTRRIIKFACRTYSESDVAAQAHAHIQAYRDLDGRDAALDMIESLVKPERSGTSDLRSYYEEMSRLDLSAHNLDQDEDW